MNMDQKNWTKKFSPGQCCVSSPCNTDCFNTISALGIGVVLLIFLTVEYAALGKAGEELTLRLRDRAFRSMIDQESSQKISEIFDFIFEI